MTGTRSAPFEERVADALAALPGVVAVGLGGSRAAGTHRPDSDWDFSIYYRGHLDVGDVRALGWPGEVSEIGDWGPVMNGGAWLTVNGTPVDLHYRDVGHLDAVRDDAEAGRFTVHRIPFFLAGIPSYVPLAELATHRTLRGALPQPEFPAALRASGERWWHGEAALQLGYAAGRARAGDLLLCAGLLARAVLEESHARLCRQGIWATNEKGLAEKAGLGEAVDAARGLEPGPDLLAGRVEQVAQLLGVVPFLAR